MLVWENTQHAFRDAGEITSEERQAQIPGYWWHATIQIWIVLPIGPVTREICFNQSKALAMQIWVVTRHHHKISALVPQTSFFRRETRGAVAKGRLFSQAGSRVYAQLRSPPWQDSFEQDWYFRPGLLKAISVLHVNWTWDESMITRLFRETSVFLIQLFIIFGGHCNR